jgi:hypothetical protein
MAMNPADTHYVRTGEPGHNWKAGDWAFTKGYGNRVQVVALQGGQLLLRFSNGTEALRGPDDIRPETFWEYITRPTGFGKTRWRAFIPQQLFLACILAAGIYTINDGGWWGIGSYLVIQAVYWYMTWRNFKGTTV